MRRRAIFLPSLLLFVTALAGGSRGSWAEGASAPKTDYRQSTLDFVNLLATGGFEEAYSRLDAAMARLLPPSRLESQWKSLESQVGPFANLGAASDTLVGGMHVVDLTTRFEWKTIIVRVAWDSTGAVSGMRYLPVPGSKDDTPPSNSPAREMEIPLYGESAQGVNLQAPNASLSIPPISGKKIPAVIVISKRDRKSLGAVAEAFRAHGIGVLRWEEKIDEAQWATECVPAIRYLQNCVEIDRRRIFLILESSAQAKSEKKNTELAGILTMPDVRLGEDQVSKLAKWILGGETGN